MAVQLSPETSRVVVGLEELIEEGRRDLAKLEAAREALVGPRKRRGRPPRAGGAVRGRPQG